MKIAIVNHSDVRGGASVVSFRLMEALRREGADVSMLVMHRATASPHVIQAGPAWRRKAAFLAEHADIFLHNGFDRSDLFKVSVATAGMPLHRHPVITEADAVILNWVNQGMLSLAEIGRMARAGKKIFWVMHDMWNMTGICHHAGECRRFCAECGLCPLVHRHHASEGDLSHRVWRRKKELYDSADITFVAVSRWLGKLAEESALLHDRLVEVIPNAFPTDEFISDSKHAPVSRESLGLPEGNLVLMGAARLDDPVKGLPVAVEALNRLDDTVRAGQSAPATAVFFGALRNPHALDSLRLPYVHLGTVSDTQVLRSLYAHAVVVLSSSLYETLPGTLIEGQASGCYPVSFGRGGQSDIIDHLRTGYIARYLDPDDLCRGITEGLARRYDADELRRSVDERFSARSVACRWLALLGNQTVDSAIKK